MDTRELNRLLVEAAPAGSAVSRARAQTAIHQRARQRGVRRRLAYAVAGSVLVSISIGTLIALSGRHGTVVAVRGGPSADCPARWDESLFAAARGSSAPADPEQVDRAALCHFGPANSGSRLTRSVDVDAAELQHLFSLRSSLSAAPSGAVVNCPLEDGALDVLLLELRPSGTAWVIVEPNGCQFVLDGTKSLLASHDLLNAIDQILNR